MSRLLMLTLLWFAVPYANRVFGKVYHVRRFAEYASPTLFSLHDSVPMEMDDVSGGREFGAGSKRRFKRADNDNLLVNMTVLPDEGHNQAIVHWSGQQSQVRL